MKIQNVEQGSPEWLQLRKDHFCASDAPAMMSASKYKSRTQLLHEKKTGQTKPVDSFTQGLFDRGHAAEDAAREIIELNLCESFAPVVGTKTVSGVNLLASLDGLTDDNKTVFEHKLLNQALAENIRNDVIDPYYFWQLEQQLLVSGAVTALFVCSDGTEGTMECMNYVSDPSRRKELLAGWKQFAKDLADYTPEVKQEAVVAIEAEAFPMVVCSVNGSMVDSNLSAYLADIKERAEIEMNRVLETDQDFADKEEINKETVKARADLKAKVESIRGEFISFKEFADTALQIDSVLQKMQSHGEKQVKQAKGAKKFDIKSAAGSLLLAYEEQCEETIKPFKIASTIKTLMPDFDLVMKGKRTIDSLQSAVDDAVAKHKIEVDKVVALIKPNQIFLREHAKDYAFLFADAAQIINQDTEPFQAIVKSRIADHKEAEAEKEQETRDRIRKEEQDKIDKKAAADLAAKTPLKVEPAPVEEVKATEDQVRPFVEESGTISQPVYDSLAADVKLSDDPFVAEIQAWAVKFQVTDEAVAALAPILDKYSK